MDGGLMRVYLANKMSGVPQFNYPWFHEAAEFLRRVYGHDVQSPAELDSDEFKAAALSSVDGSMETFPATETWGDILAKDVKLIADGGIEAVIVGPQWQESRGAKLEAFVAYQLGLPVLRYPDLVPIPRITLASAWIGAPVALENGALRVA
jgi:hypothetical protein